MHSTTSILSFLVFFTLCFNNTYAQEGKNKTNVGVSTSEGDSIVLAKDQLEDIVDYKAQNISNDFSNKISYLLTKASVDYKDISLTADYITIDWNTNMVSAFSKMDSTGRVLEKATFTQAGKENKYESFTFNFKTEKGIVYNGRTTEDELVIDAQVSKRINDSIYFMRNAFVTGDEYYKADKDTVADYHILLNRGKYIEDEALIAGASQLYIEQVPTPLFLPFLYVPLKGERSAGIILPSFGETDQLGFFLQGFGVYTPIGPYFDFEVLGDLYTKGSVGVHANSSYKKNYRFSGRFSADIEKRILGIKGITSGANAYSENKNFRISWSHSQDRKANPNLIFSTNVNYTSSKYYRQSVDNNNIYNQNFLNNTSNSSISLNKYFNEFPMNFSINASLNQNFNTDLANLELPTITGNLSRQYPFKNASNVSLIKKFYFNYNLGLQNRMAAVNEDLFKSETFKNAKSGMKNSFSSGTQTTLFNFFPLSLSANYDEIWTLKTISKYYDTSTQQVITEQKNGFSAFRTYGMSANLSTVLYGTALFKKENLVQGIRHTFQPSVSYSIRPDFSSDRYNYYEYYTDANGNEVQYSKFENGVYGSPGKGLQNVWGFNIGNNLEMKVRDKTDSLGVKKIKIFDYLNLGTSYNVAADSLKMSDISINGSTTFFDNKFKLNYRTSINPYKIVYANEQATTGQMVDQLGYFSVANYNIGLNFSLNNAFFGKEIDYATKYPTTGRVRYENYYFDEEHYAHFNVPWSANIGFQYRHIKNLSREANNAISVSISGNLSPSPYWELSYSTSYDFVSQKMAFTRITLTRDLRSFIINFNWVPFGNTRSWNFGINIKTNVLRDALKYDDRDYRSNNRPF